jgi:hypothetical protein
MEVHLLVGLARVIAPPELEQGSWPQNCLVHFVSPLTRFLRELGLVALWHNIGHFRTVRVTGQRHMLVCVSAR